MTRHLAAFTAALFLSAAPAALAQTTLNVGMAAADVGQLDPHRATTTQDKPVVAWIFNGLVRFAPGSASLEGLEPDLADAEPGERYQFERLGYFFADPIDSVAEAPVFNRTVTLRDTWGK